MISKLRTRNPEFETGSFPPWQAIGNVAVSSDVACLGFRSALFDGAGTGLIFQTNTAYPRRLYQLLFEAGASGGTVHAPLVVTVQFLNSSGSNSRVLKTVQFTVPADSLPDVTGATPVPCTAFDLSVGSSPNGTHAVRLTFAKSVPGGADLVLDGIYLIEHVV